MMIFQDIIDGMSIPLQPNRPFEPVTRVFAKEVRTERLKGVGRTLDRKEALPSRL